MYSSSACVKFILVSCDCAGIPVQSQPSVCVCETRIIPHFVFHYVDSCGWTSIGIHVHVRVYWFTLMTFYIYIVLINRRQTNRIEIHHVFLGRLRPFFSSPPFSVLFPLTARNVDPLLSRSWRLMRYLRAQNRISVL